MTRYTAVPYRPVVAPGEELVFSMVKPDGTVRRLSDEVLHRLSATGLSLVLAKYVLPTEAMARAHVARKNGSSGVTEAQAVAYLTSGHVLAMVWRGRDAIRRVRAIVGQETDPCANRRGTVRRDFADDSITDARREGRACRNVLHSSNNPESALYEITAWFTPAEFAHLLQPTDP